MVLSLEHQIYICFPVIFEVQPAAEKWVQFFPPHAVLLLSLLLNFPAENLEVDRTREVEWNDKAFNNLVAYEDTNEMVLALVTNRLATEKGTDLIESKGNGLILLLRGPPGTGKTYTAESVAEIAKKPLYPVTCGDIGTEPEAVEKYLESVFYLGKIWGCVVLLDEAEVFLEQRTLHDLKRNALVSGFLRAIEYYEGIMILTTNRVGTFDEAFKSRIQLALRYEKLDKHQRKQIWRNFMTRLKDISEQDSIDFDEIQNHTEELADYPMNGQQIRNSISKARQLAKFKKTKMNFAHLTRTINLADKFDQYLVDVREGDPEENEERGENGRYSDDFFARADCVR
jgi:SpoVK/Ycf46/Vps4 family AAA+-type ATPase